MRWGAVLVLLGASTLALAQESALHAELRREGERASDACQASFKAVPGCAYTLFTDHPLHIAVGSMPPQNGFGLGGAFVWSKNTRNWRMSWDFDGVGAFSGAWRAGAYMKMVHTPHPAKAPIKVTIPRPGETPKESGEAKEEDKPKGPEKFTHPYAVFDFYAQSISLNKLNFFGLGNDSPLAGKSLFGMSEISLNKLNFFGLGNDSPLAGKSLFGMSERIVGASAIKPVFEWAAIRWLNLALLGEINGRFVDIRGKHGQSVPSIEALYTDATAPGLSSQPGFAQLGEGLRIKPAIGNLQLNYMGKFQQFFAPSSSHNSFLRWTVDLDHTYSLYGRSQSGLLLSESITSATSAVPFYFQPTLGGSDINGGLALGSYQDYRFRAPNVLLLQESFEHSIWGPFGLKLMADQGRVALMRGDIGFSHLKHSFAGGLTLRAGGFPMISLMFAWGGPEGHHNIANMNTSLLGGSARPLLD